MTVEEVAMRVEEVAMKVEDVVMIVGDVVMTAEDVAEVVVVEVVEVHTKHTIKGTEVITTKTRPRTGQGE